MPLFTHVGKTKRLKPAVVSASARNKMSAPFHNFSCFIRLSIKQN